ncbi:MAG: hypothetical protein ACOH12_00955 [Parvibaculaceae bacterium]
MSLYGNPGQNSPGFFMHTVWQKISAGGDSAEDSHLEVVTMTVPPFNAKHYGFVF